jgi:hypothetical protein
MIFDEEYGKLSGSFGLVRAPSADAAEAFAAWQRSILSTKGSSHVAVKQLPYGLRECFEGLLPLVTPVPTKHLFIPTTGPWTVFANNFHLGTDAVAPMSMVSGLLRTDGMRVVAHRQKFDPSSRRISQYGATILEYYSHGKTQRSIACANDGGKWVFYAGGEPFGFENLEAYQRKPVKERFSKELLLGYLVQLGVGRFGDELCSPGPEATAYLIEITR